MPKVTPFPPAWHGKCFSPANGDDAVTLIAYDDAGEAVEFIVSRSLLVCSSEWFATALSGEWSETSTQTQETSKSVTRDALSNYPVTKTESDKVAGSPAGKHLGVSATITFQDGPQAVHDLLCYLHPSTEVRLRPDTVEPLLHLAEMTGLRLLVEKCGDFLCKKASWDPVGTLRLAEQYHLPKLYVAAGHVLLSTHDQLDMDYAGRLSSGTSRQLRHRFRAFQQEVSLIAARNVVGRVENRCKCCAHLIRFKNSLVLNVLRAALATKPGQTHQLMVAVNHPPSCDGGMRRLSQLEAGMSLEGDKAASVLLDDCSAPSDMADLLLWSARRVDPMSGVSTIAQWLETMAAEDRRNAAARVD